MESAWREDVGGEITGDHWRVGAALAAGV